VGGWACQTWAEAKEAASPCARAGAHLSAKQVPRAPAQLKARAQRRANGARCAGAGGAPLTQRTGLWALSRDEGQWCKHERYGSAFARLGHGVQRRSAAERGVTRGGQGPGVQPQAARSAFLHRTALRVLVHGDTAVRAHLCSNSPCGYRAPGLPTCRVVRRSPKGRTQKEGTCLFCMGRPAPPPRIGVSLALRPSQSRVCAQARQQACDCGRRRRGGARNGEAVCGRYGRRSDRAIRQRRPGACAWRVYAGACRDVEAQRQSQRLLCAAGSRVCQGVLSATDDSSRAWTLAAPCRARTRSLQTIVVRTGLPGRTGQRCKAATVAPDSPVALRTPFPCRSVKGGTVSKFKLPVDAEHKSTVIRLWSFAFPHSACLAPLWISA
jgi:hypothetical protein